MKAFLGLLLLATPVAAAPLSESVRPAVEAGYADFDTAFAWHDLNRMMAYFTPDYTTVNEKGEKSSREQARRQYADQLGPIKTLQVQSTVESLIATSEGAVVEMKMHAWGVGEKRLLFVKMSANFTDDLWVRDTWVKTPQGWRIRFRQRLREERKIHSK